MSSSEISKEAKKIIEEARRRGLRLRLMGACAIEAHCQKYRHLWSDKLRRELTDIDLASYLRFRPDVKKLLEDFGYTTKKMLMVDESYRWRDIYTKTGTGLVVDVFFDKLSMCHTINFENRLEVDYPTIPLAELLLEKLQIVNIAEKDIKDIIVLLREHEVGEGDRETINAKYISQLLSKDWGFYYTVKNNLDKIKKYLLTYGLAENDVTDVNGKIATLLQQIENEPKPLRWKIRGKLGTSIKWYREVK
jgi:hypothetical protein